MAEFREDKNDNDPQMRKLLSNLPKVKAQPDFEQHLHRRIAGEKDKRPPSILESLKLKRIPMVAYSLATLVILGTIVYYAFFRSGTLPNREFPLIQKNESSSQQQVQDQSGKPSPTERPEAPITNHPPSAGQELPKSKNGETNRQGSSGQSESKGLHESNQSAELKKVDRDHVVGKSGAQEEMKTERALSPQQSESQPQLFPPQSKSITTAAESENVVQPSSETNARTLIAPSKEQQKGANMTPSAFYNYSAHGEVKQLHYAPLTIHRDDSTAIKDSIRTDSLRRELEKLQHLKQTTKSKKPL
jgi:hypothetical protein